MSKDTIYRQAAIVECNKRGAEHVGYAIAHLPSAQPEIIRCKDCKWFCEMIHQCDRQVSAVMFENDFCSYAERKDA